MRPNHGPILPLLSHWYLPIVDVLQVPIEAAWPGVKTYE
jgi:hypothetical protein